MKERENLHLTLANFEHALVIQSAANQINKAKAMTKTMQREV